MELFLLEHTKLWRKRIVKICVLLCFIYIVIFGNILSFQWFSFGSSGDYTSAFGNNFDGYGVIRESQEYALNFGEELTDETLQQVVRDYQRMEAAGMEKELEKSDWKIINSWLATLYPELRDTETYQTMISYVNPDKLTGFYERREQAISDFLENNGQTGAEKEYLLRMEKEVESPFRYGWVDGWSELLASMVADLGSVMALFLAIVLSSLFAGEWYDNTSPLVLTTKNGWGKVASAKILTGLVFTVEFFAILVIPRIIAKLLLLSLEESEDELLNAVMSVLDGFENTKRVVEEKLCAKLVFEGIEIDISRRLIYRGKSEIKTTFVEFEILHLLARNPGKVFSKEQIYDIVWKEPYSGDYNIVMSHIRNLREKIEDNPSKPIYIQTVWGVGYRFNKNLSNSL